MESVEGEVIAIVYIKDGWYLVDLNDNMRKITQAYDHADAVQAAQTRAYRIAQGWRP